MKLKTHNLKRNIINMIKEFTEIKEDITQHLNELKEDRNKFQR